MDAKQKKTLLELLKKSSFLIFLVAYIAINAYLGGIVNWEVLAIVVVFVVVLNIFTIFLAPYIVNVKELREIDKKLKEIQQNPFAALTNQEELLNLFAKKQQLMQRYIIFSIAIFIAGIYLLELVTKGSFAWQNFKIEFPFVGAAATAFVAYLLLTYAIFPFITELRKRYGLA